MVRREIKKIENLGVNIHTNVTVGTDLNVDQLFARGYDAIFMGTGTGRPKSLPIEGIDHPGGVSGHRLPAAGEPRARRTLREEPAVRPGDCVGVVGCGNSAMDAARTAVRMGASEVTVLYHRTIDRMAALRSEYDDAVAEGVRFIWKASVTKVIGAEGDRLDHVEIDVDGEKSVMPLDRLILAVGSAPATRIVSSTTGIEVDEKGYVVTREFPYGMSTRSGVFCRRRCHKPSRHCGARHARRQACGRSE